MAYSFTAFKDTSVGLFDSLAGALARSPSWVQDVAYAVLRVLVRGVYYLPGSYVRKVATNLSKQPAVSVAPKAIYFGLADGLVRMLRALEVLSRGGDLANLPSFTMSDEAQQRLNDRVGKGAILAMPHSTGSLLSVRSLASRYNVLMLIKEPKNSARAQKQKRFFENLGCEILDVRRTDPSKVARTIFKALRQGRFVIGTCDRIRSQPPHGLMIHKESDTIRCIALGQAVGAVGWPARFAHKCQLPIIPLMPANQPKQIELHVGQPIEAVGDSLQDTQAWLDGMFELFCAYPEHWMFAYDKKWASLLKQSQS
ncbi:MAG: hypothetical protein ACSHX8_15905 [Opitutaceae bacterium]